MGFVWSSWMGLFYTQTIIDIRRNERSARAEPAAQQKAVSALQLRGNDACRDQGAQFRQTRAAVGSAFFGRLQRHKFA